MSTCIVCGTKDNVRKIKKIPYPLGRVGHVTLKEWSNYCVDCMISEGEKFCEMMDKHIAEMKNPDLLQRQEGVRE